MIPITRCGPELRGGPSFSRTLRLRGRASIALLSGILVSLAWAPTPLWACSCSEPSLDQALLAANVVFAGTVVERRAPYGPYAEGSTIEVDTVWQGEAAAKVRVVFGDFDWETGISETSSCDMGLDEGLRYLVFARQRSDGYLSVDWCSLTEAWADGTPPSPYADLIVHAGEGRKPDLRWPTHAPPPDADRRYVVPTRTAAAYPGSSDSEPLQPADETGPEGPPSTPFSPLPWLALGLLVVLAPLAIRRRIRAG